MTTGFVERVKGKARFQVLYLGSGGIIPADGSVIPSGLKVALPVTAVANTDFVASIPAGRTLLRATVYTTTAYTGTTVTVQIGSTAGGNDYVTAVSIKAAAIVPLTLLLAALASLPAVPNIFVRVVQTGPTAVGAATLVLEYA